jgi:hypothetical protein
MASVQPQKLSVQANVDGWSNTLRRYTDTANGWNDGKNGIMPDALVATNEKTSSISLDAPTQAAPPHGSKAQPNSLHDTHPGISQIMLTRLQVWRQHQETQLPVPTLPALQIAYLNQQEIGWFNFLQGRISTRWVIMQSDYYQLINSKRTATTWARRIICHLWELSRNMWLHRNQILHESPNAETEKLSRRMDRRILSEFRKNLDGLSPPHHYLLRRNPLNRVLKWQNHEKLAWLDTVTIARRAWHRRRSQARRQRQIICNLSCTTATTDAT